ncbi:MAG: phosphorylcholine transferase LicD [Bacilli bacterium]
MKYNEYDKKTLDKLHEVELEILDEFTKICKKHNLNYFLTGGTMLGAVRHEGFIPWDDDIDIGMPRHDYDLFVKYAQTELDKKYYLDCYETNKNYYLPFSKIKKNNTIFDEESTHHIDNHKGIFIDIIPFENAKKQDSLTQKIQAILVRNIQETIFCKIDVRKIKNTRHPLLTRILNIFSKQTLMNVQNKLLHMNKDDNSEYLVALAGTYGYQKETSKRSVFLPGKKIKFNNREYYGMNDPDAYLTKIFGNYMELPPKDKRVNHVPLKIDFGEK